LPTKKGSPHNRSAKGDAKRGQGHRIAERLAVWPSTTELAKQVTRARVSLNLCGWWRLERQHPRTQEFWTYSTVHRSLEGFQPVDLSFGLTVIPRLSDQNRWAQSRSPMDMMRHG
jgi:hypothetical protein